MTTAADALAAAMAAVSGHTVIELAAALRDAERWRVIEYCLMGDDNEGAPEFATLIAEIAYRHQIDIGILRLPKPTTLQLIDELAEGYKRGDDAARAAIAKESP